MSPTAHSPGTAPALQAIAAELDQVAREIGALKGRVAATIGSTSTGADKRMLAGLTAVVGSTRGAQQALSAAAHALPAPRPR